MNPGDWRATLKKAGLLASSRLSARSADYQQRVHFFGISLQGGHSFARRLFKLIPRLPSGASELMTHPGYADASLAAQDDYTRQRETELRVLCSSEFRDLLGENRVALTSFAELRAMRPHQEQLAQHY